eukprot:5729323-Ditylum_brightwellii.AAC.2
MGKTVEKVEPKVKHNMPSKLEQKTAPRNRITKPQNKLHKPKKKLNNKGKGIKVLMDNVTGHVKYGDAYNALCYFNNDDAENFVGIKYEGQANDERSQKSE